MKMNPQIKKRWLEALRSEKYTQGNSYLCYNNGFGISFCCLGVLCDLHAQETGNEWKPDKDESQVQTYLMDNQCTSSKGFGTLPDEVRMWAGLETQNPEIPKTDTGDGYKADTLAAANDGGLNFEQIANIIEVNF